MVIIFELHKDTGHMQWSAYVNAFYFASMQIHEIKQSFVLSVFNLLSEEHRMVAILADMQNKQVTKLPGKQCLFWEHILKDRIFFLSHQFQLYKQCISLKADNCGFY